LLAPKINTPIRIKDLSDYIGSSLNLEVVGIIVASWRMLRSTGSKTRGNATGKYSILTFFCANARSSSIQFQKGISPLALSD